MQIIKPALFFALICCWACQQNPMPPLPENGIVDERDNPKKDSLKKEYLAQRYFADPGTNVDSIRAENRKRNLFAKELQRREVQSRNVGESFANGQILATWHERGPNNEAGDMRVIDFDPATENLYAISTVGHLWKGHLSGASWKLLNDDLEFQPDEIEVVPHNGGIRLFAIHGTGVDDKKIRFSDNEGQTWTTGTGFTFHDHWGKGRRLHVLSDNQTLYYLVHTWSSNPWGELIQLYKSTNKGVSYTQIWTSPVGYKGEDVDLFKPYDSDDMYLVDNRAQQLFKVTHNLATGTHSISAAQNYVGQGITTGGVHLSGRFNNTLNTHELFLIHDSEDKVYKTTFGNPWTYLSTASDNVWVKGWLADPENSNLYVGSFQLNKTSNGVNWQEQYPQWWRYYSHSKDSMHVDIMNLEYFKKSNGTSFILILNHAGVHITYDHFATTANLGLNDLNVVTLYDQTTASDGFLYCGAQDKGTFAHHGNSLANFDPLATINKTTGDGMIGAFFNSDQSFFSMIQNGSVGCLPNRNTSGVHWYNIPGDNKPGWINPMVSTPNFTDRQAYMAGGNLNGGTGSYLINMNVNLTPFSWQPSQYNYDFRANSNNGTSVIKAIGVSQSNDNRLYVATQDATFFSSNNQGTTWTKHTTAALPTSMVPWDIKCSPNNPDKVFISGTGFSNHGVFQSNDGGATFSALSGSIPLATFYEVALSSTEDMLFAATSEGPYVYIFAESKWYNLIGAETPLLDFNTVDNVGGNVIRFGTYGRGVWDFQINSSLPAILNAFEATPTDQGRVALEWQTSSEVNVRDFVVSHSDNGTNFKSIGTVNATGKNNMPQRYRLVHNNPVAGTNYYRLQIRDNDGQAAYSPIKQVQMDGAAPVFTLYPTLLDAGQVLQLNTTLAAPYRLLVYNAAGQLVMEHKGEGSETVPTIWIPGTYFYQIHTQGHQQSGRIQVR